MIQHVLVAVSPPVEHFWIPKQKLKLHWAQFLKKTVECSFWQLNPLGKQWASLVSGTRFTPPCIGGGGGESGPVC